MDAGPPDEENDRKLRELFDRQETDTLECRGSRCRMELSFKDPSTANDESKSEPACAVEVRRFMPILLQMRRICWRFWLVIALLTISFLALAVERSDADLPQKYQKSPYTLMSLSVGSPSNGWQLRAKRLRPNDSLFIKSNSRSNVYGHPALVLMLDRSAQRMAKDAPGARLLVGDLSSKYGGPLVKHRSHQSGRDADVGFFMTDKKGRPRRTERFVGVDSLGNALDGSGYKFDDYRNWLLVQLWMKDTRAKIMYVFVASHLRKRLLDFAKARPAFSKYVAQASTFLRQPSNSSAHGDHFHVRIACPARQEPLCVQNVSVSD